MSPPFLFDAAFRRMYHTGMEYIIDTIFDISAAMAMMSLTLTLIAICVVFIIGLWRILVGN